MRQFGVVVLAAACVCAFCWADTFTETWYLAGGGIARGPHSFADKGPGPDRLPYTADDETLPVHGNAGGTWSFAFLDIDGDGNDDHAFCLVRRGDDDMFTLSSWSDFAHGIIAEGEYWADGHHMRDGGPTGNDPTGDDFEWNDRPGWERESNWLWYNNMRANQRGLGGSRYYFEYRDAFTWPEEAVDEVQLWSWTLSFRNNTDNGTGIRGYWGTSSDLLVKGLFIPVKAIPDLKDGELDPLFGWQSQDMAQYVRDVLYPKLADPDLTVFIHIEDSNACATTSSLPATYVMIVQAETRIIITDYFKAELWGIGFDDTPVFRWSSILLKGDNPNNPAITLEPEDGRYLNLWRRDAFVRDTVGAWGALETGTFECPDACWQFVPDGIEDCQLDYALRLPAASGPENTYLRMPLGRVLDGLDGALVARASVALENPAAEFNRIELILADGGTPAAWVSIQSTAVPRLGVGGDDLYDAMGMIAAPAEHVEGDTLITLAAEGEGYTEIELLFDPATKRLELRIDGALTAQMTYTARVITTANALWLRAQSDGPETGVTVDDISVLQAYSLETGEAPRFRRADANGDGHLNIADAVTVLTYLFAGGTLPCLDAADSNDDGKLDIADAIATLGYLFGGAPEPPAPGVTTCGPDPTPDGAHVGGDLGCEEYLTCE